MGGSKVRYRVAVAVAVALVVVLALPAAGLSIGGVDSDRGPSGEGEVPTGGLKLSNPGPERKADPSRFGAGLPMAASRDLSDDAPPIGDQGMSNSCVGWSTGYYAKTWYEKQEYPTRDLDSTRYQFSPSFIYNQINGGADNGSSIMDALELLKGTGVCDWAEFTYDGNYLKQPNSTDIKAAAQYKISDWGYFFAEASWAHISGPFSHDLTAVKSWVNSGNPVVMGIPIYDDFPDFNGNAPSSYYTSANSYSSSEFLGGHAVFIVGYNDNINPSGSTADTKGGFLVRNSWGPTWNNNGTVWLSYKFVKKWVPEAWFMEDQDSTPTVASVSPSIGSIDTLVTIIGTNFGAKRRSARVGFSGDVDGTITSWDNDEIKVRVPEGTRSGEMFVYDWNSERSNRNLFSVSSLPGIHWLFAEGATWPGFEEWVLVQNPNSTPSTVAVNFMTPGGTVPGPELRLESLSRTSIRVNDFVPDQDVSTAISVLSGDDVCAERVMYVNTADGKWGSHDSIGTASIAEKWYLAEGATWPGYDEWVLVMNPNEQAVRVVLTFQTPEGEVAGPSLELPAMTRQSVHVNDHLPGRDVSTVVTSLDDGLGVVAERSMYVRTADGKLGCHNSMGTFETSDAWGLAEGATWPGFEEWVLVQNPTTRAADVSFLFLTPQGVTRGPDVRVLPGKRESVRVNDYLPDSDVSTLVVTEDEGQKVVVERAMYISDATGKRGAHNAIGSIFMSTAWMLPEGCTSQGFDEWVLVMNPDAEESATVRLTFMKPGGVVRGPAASVPPASRETFHVNDYYTGDVSTLVESDRYVISERAMYVNTADGKRGAHCSIALFAPSAAGSSGGSGTPLGADNARELRSQYLIR
jgi:hypothetical protein